MKIKLSPINLIILSILFILCITTIIYSAYAEPINLPLEPIYGPVNGPYLDQTIGIEVSKYCIISGTCPSNDFLVSQGLDNSMIQSGKFSNKTGIVLREHTTIKNESYLYSFVPYSLIVNPSHNLSLKIKMIYIVPSLDAYLLPEDMKKQNDTRLIHKERYTDPKCRESIISGKSWLVTLPDTISYMRNNCNPKFSSLETFDIIKDNQTYIDISTTQSYKDKQWLEEAKKISKNNFLLKQNP